MTLAILTLAEIMKRFDLPGFSALSFRLRTAQIALSELGKSPNQNTDWSLFVGICEHAAKYCESVGFHHSSRKAFHLMCRLQTIPWTFNASGLEGQFVGLEQDITLDIARHKFVQVEQALTVYFEAKNLMGPGVAKAFPSASHDISEAGDCLSVGANAAAVFHLMHVVEWGLRAIARNLGLYRVVANKKSGKTIPVEYAQWEKVLNQLPAKVETKVNAMRSGPSKQRAQEFYYPALKEIEGFKEAWRNHVMHARREYTSKDAIAVLSHVDRFMKTMAEHGICESSRKRGK